MMGDLIVGFLSSFKQQVIKNIKGKNFWEIFFEFSSMGGVRIMFLLLVFLFCGFLLGVSEDLVMDLLFMLGLVGFFVSDVLFIKGVNQIINGFQIGLM